MGLTGDPCVWACSRAQGFAQHGPELGDGAGEGGAGGGAVLANGARSVKVNPVSAALV